MNFCIGIVLISLIFSGNTSKNYFPKKLIKDSSLKLTKININKRNLQNEGKTTIPTTKINTTEPLNTTPTTIPEEKNITEFVVDELILGFDHYTYEYNILSFFTYITKFLNKNGTDFLLPLIITRDLRYLEDIKNQANCTLESNTSDIYKYNCSINNISGAVTKVEVDVKNSNLKYSKLAEITAKNLQTQTGDKISDKGIVIISECEMQNNSNTFIIKGKNHISFNNKSNATLYVVNNKDTIVNINATLNYINNKTELKLTPKSTIKANLNETLGKIIDDKNIYLIFKDSNSTEPYLEYTPNLNIYHNKKSSGGLSGGGIVAIILPCIAVLLAITAIAFIMGRKPTNVSGNQNIVSNSLGINSSTNVVK